MAITAKLVKELRERTGAGMMECKKALVKVEGDIEAAIDFLRKSGQLKAAKRADKIAAEGVVLQAVSGLEGLLLEINSETDFVARDDNFRAFAQLLVERALTEKAQDIDALMQLPKASGSDETLEQTRQALVAKIGENVKPRRLAWIKASGVVGAYLHGDRIGVLVALDKNNPALAKDIAMHIAASNPKAIGGDDIPAELLAREKDIYLAQAKESGKPDNIIEKMVVGRMKKFMQENSLLGQPFVKDPEVTVADLLAKNDNAKIEAFVRFEVGEGIEKATQNFADEVRAQVEDNQ